MHKQEKQRQTIIDHAPVGFSFDFFFSGEGKGNVRIIYPMGRGNETYYLK